MDRVYSPLLDSSLPVLTPQLNARKSGWSHPERLHIMIQAGTSEHLEHYIDFAPFKKEMPKIVSRK